MKRKRKKKQKKGPTVHQLRLPTVGQFARAFATLLKRNYDAEGKDDCLGGGCPTAEKYLPDPDRGALCPEDLQKLLDAFTDPEEMASEDSKLCLRCASALVLSLFEFTCGLAEAVCGKRDVSDVVEAPDGRAVALGLDRCPCGNPAYLMQPSPAMTDAARDVGAVCLGVVCCTPDTDVRPTMLGMVLARSLNAVPPNDKVLVNMVNAALPMCPINIPHRLSNDDDIDHTKVPWLLGFDEDGSVRVKKCTEQDREYFDRYERFEFN